MIDLVSDKLQSDGYQYVKLQKADPRPDFSKYVEIERNAVSRVVYTIFIGSITHMIECNFVRIGEECFYLINDENEKI